MLSISVLLLFLGVSPETGLYVEGQAQETVLEKAILLEELQARLPSLQVTAVPTQNQGRFFTLSYAENRGDSGQTKLLFILRDADEQVLLKRTLRPDKQSLATARQIALVIEGIIKRRGDALNEILLAQQSVSKVEPTELAKTVPKQPSDKLQIDAALTFGSFPAAKRPTLGTQLTAKYALWRSLLFGVQGGFQGLLKDGDKNDEQARIALMEWNALGISEWQYRYGDLGFSLLGGLGIALSQVKAQNNDPNPSFGQTDVLFLMRASLGISWKILSDFSVFANFSADLAPSYPVYRLQSEKLLSRGSTSIFAGLGCRYSLF